MGDGLRTASECSEQERRPPLGYRGSAGWSHEVICGESSAKDHCRGGCVSESLRSAAGENLEGRGEERIWSSEYGSMVDA